MIGFLNFPPQYMFFTGKGGVGKTTTAAATAIHLADQGKKVLLVSTDPASNLDEVLGVELSGTPRPVPEAPGLLAINIDPEEAARAYRELLVGPYRGVLPEAAVRSMEEQLSGACTVEIAAFNEFANLLGNREAVVDYEHVVFDTAPTSHTLRLLELPAAWSDFISTNPGGTSCLGPLAGLKEQHKLYENTRTALADPALTLVVVVSRPDTPPLHEAARAATELRALNITNQHLVVNGVFTATDSDDAVATALAERGERALSELPAALSAHPRTSLPLRAREMVGVPALRSFFTENIPDPSAANLPESPPHLPGLDALLREIGEKDAGVIMTMGKGGVGKTTLAVTIAAALARRGKKVHLTTTDPAAAVDSLSTPSSSQIRVSRIDPKVETEAYAAEVIATVGQQLDDEGKALLEEDLRSPCTEEIAVFRAFARVVAEGTEGFVIIDTAPTGHTLLLLDAAESYHREVSRSLSDIPESVRQLLPRLRDPQFTHVLLVTLPEATPVHEAVALQNDLLRASVEPYAWIVNQSLSPLEISDPVLISRRTQESRYLNEVVQLAKRSYIVPWLKNPAHDALLTTPQLKY